MWKNRARNDRLVVQGVNSKTKKFAGFIIGKDMLDLIRKAELYDVKISGNIWMIPKGHTTKS